MKRIIFACLLAAGAFIPGILNAQALKLDIQGITYEEDTLTSKDNIIAHTAISVKKTEKSSAIRIGGSGRSSIRVFEFGWNMADTDHQGEWFNLRNWRSNQVTINPFIFSATSNEGNIGLSLAFGLRFNNYMFDGPFTVAKQDGMAVYAPIVYQGGRMPTLLRTGFPSPLGHLVTLTICFSKKYSPVFRI